MSGYELLYGQKVDPLVLVLMDCCVFMGVLGYSKKFDLVYGLGDSHFYNILKIVMSVAMHSDIILIIIVYFFAKLLLYCINSQKIMSFIIFN